MCREDDPFVYLGVGAERRRGGRGEEGDDVTKSSSPEQLFSLDLFF